MLEAGRLQKEAPGRAAKVERSRRAAPQTRYFAFLSYSHKDEQLAAWLHRELEHFRVPPSLVGRLTANGVIPKRLRPIFRDEQELAAADDLGEEIKAALAASQFLVVLCSPHAARSRWTNSEVETFKRTRPDGCVLAAIAAGEPFASEIAGRRDECLPPALRQKFDRRGRPTGKRAEPLAADLRGEDEERRLGLLKLVAGMLGVGLDELLQRHTTRRQRRLALMTAASIAGMGLTTTLAITAFQARDEAREQRREAEGLVAYMLGDLKDKLEPIGRLDALDGVGSRVLAYYRDQDPSQLSDDALLQRSKALSLTAQVSYSRGDLDQAARLYQQAMAGTQEAIRRDPEDPRRLFDHAQNVFAVGDIARQRSRPEWVESSAREYKRLARQMVALEPDNMKWRMEEQYADVNLGVALYEQRRFREAANQFEQGLRTIEALATADPRNSGYQQSVAETLAWLADARMAEGRLDEAIAHRGRHIGMLQRLIRTGGENVAYRQMLVPARRALGNLYASKRQMEPALEQLRLAVEQADALTRIEDNNSQWLGAAAAARLDLAQTLLAAGQSAPAAGETQRACAAVQNLTSRDSSVQQWRAMLRDCHAVRARIALTAGDAQAALQHAEQALRVARSTRSNDAAANLYALARAQRLVGDALDALGKSDAARAAWMSALGVLPGGLAERPSEMSERETLLARVGRRAEAAQIAAKLKQIGYNRVT